MLNYLLYFLVLVSFSIFILIKYNIKLEKTIPYTLISIVLVLYIFGLINILKYGVYFIIILAIISYILSIYYFIKSKNKKDIIKKIISPGFIIWILFYLLLLYYHHDRLLVEWDEFTHWGDVVKMMYNNNVFNTNKLSFSANKSYLPGISLFEYFCSKFFSSFKEETLFISYQLFAFSFFLPFIEKLSWKKWYMIIPTIILIFLSNLVFFETYYKNIYVDQLLALIFAFCISIIYLDKDKSSKLFILKISLGLSMLVLTKDLGIVLSAICIFSILLYSIIKRRKEFTKKDFLKKLYSISKVSLILVSIVLLTYLLWKLNIKLNVKSGTGGLSINLKFFIDSILGIDNTYGTTVRNTYIGVLRTYRIINGLIKLNSIKYIIIITLFFIIITIYNNKNKISDDKTTLFISLLGYIAYIILILFLYLMMFTEVEALNLASWNRYLGSYFQAFIYILSFILLDITYRKKHNYFLILYIIILFLIIPIKTITNTFNRNIENNYGIREPYTISAKNLKEKLGDKKVKIYFISQNDNGYNYWIWRYSCRENLSYINENYEVASWSIGNKYTFSDIWTQYFTKEEWMNLLIKDYEYVYLYKVDENFINMYGSLFDDTNNIKDNTLFIINKDKKKLEIVN